IAVALVVYFGGQRVLGGSLTTGQWYLFVQTLNLFLFPMTSIASFWSQFQQGLSASERVFALIDADPKVVQTAREPIEHIKGRITFGHVRFSYGESVVPGPLSVVPLDNEQRTTDQGQWVLPDFSLDIPAGQTLAVVGHTGAGKSSLA